MNGTFPLARLKSRVMHPTDAELVRRSLQEARAFEHVFERHFDRVHAYLRRQVGTQLAEELCAETFTRAFDARARFDLRRPDAAPWLFGIASNVLLEHRRRERREGAASWWLPASVAEAADDRAAALADALAALSAVERETLLLHAWADLSYAEIAEALDVRIGTVRSRLSRAREHMRARLALPQEVACDG